MVTAIARSRRTARRLAASAAVAVLALAAAPPAHAASCPSGRRVTIDPALRLVGRPGRQVRLFACPQGSPARAVAHLAPDRYNQRGALREVALRPGLPYAALLFASGELEVAEVHDDGTSALWAAAGTQGAVRGSLALDPAHHRVTWRAGRRRLSAPLLPSPGCPMAGHDLLRTPEVRVFSTDPSRERPPYACLVSTGRTTEMSSPEHDDGGNGAMEPIPDGGIRAAGPIVAYQVPYIWDPDGYVDMLQLLDLSTGALRTVDPRRDRDGNAAIDTFVVTASGTVAYTERLLGGGGPCPKLSSTARLATSTGLIAADPSKSRTLECEPDPVQADPNADRVPSITDLRVDGDTLTWLSLGQPRSTTLG